MPNTTIEKSWFDLTTENRRSVLDELGVGDIDPDDLNNEGIDKIACMGNLNGLPQMVRTRVTLSYTGKGFFPEHYFEIMKPILGRREETPPINKSFESQLRDIQVRRERGR